MNRMPAFLRWFTLALFGLHAAALLADRPRLAVMPITATGDVSPAAAATATDLAMSRLINQGVFTIVERTELSKVYEEQAFQQTGVGEADAARIGHLVSANKVLVGTLARPGQRYVLTLRIIDVEKGIAEHAGTGSTESLESLDRVVTGAVHDIVSHYEGNRTEPARRDLLARQKRWNDAAIYAAIPGGTQLARGQVLGGSLFLGSFLSAGAAYAHYRAAYDTARSANGQWLMPFLSLGFGNVGLLYRQQHFVAIRHDMRAASAGANAALATAGLVWLWSLADALASSPPVAAGTAGWRASVVWLPERVTRNGERGEFAIAIRGYF